MYRRDRAKTFVLAGLLFAMVIASVHCSVEENSEPSPMSQQRLDRMAETLDIRYTVLENRVKGHCEAGASCFSVEIVLTAKQAIESADWQLYFSQLFPLRKVESNEFHVESINGDLKRLVPTENFTGFEQGESKRVVLYLKGAHVNEFEVMPNYYLAANGREARVITSTVPTIDPVTGLERLPHLVSFTDPEKQFKISDRDQMAWATSAVLYENNKDTYLDTSGVDSAIVPTPLSVELDPSGERLDLSKGLKLSLEGLPRSEVAVALERLAEFGIGENPAGVPVSIVILERGDKPEGAYTLAITGTGIEIEAEDSHGAFYGLQSLASLVTLGQTSVPVLKIEDEPRYAFRGMHLDVARNFHSKALVIDLLDQMAAYKLNKLHFHLGDDEGWRVEIAGLPELTDIGGKRCHDLTESQCLLPQLGSGPYGNTQVDGYYSAVDYQAILRAASARHIQVIPSFDMPGHARSEVKAMEARYRKFMALGNEREATRYLLSDLDDTSKYSSIQNYTDNTINVCMESTYAFIEKVISEMQALHAQAGQPLTRYHIGADETAGAWLDSPVCKKFLAENTQGIEHPRQLGAYFIERVAGILQKKGIEPAGWSDGMGHTDAANMPDVVQTNVWGRLVDPAHFAAHKQANQGWEVVISTPDVTYFDMPHEADPKERGYYWASRGTNSRKVYEFMPDNLPAHAEFWFDSEGRAFSSKDSTQYDSHGEVVHSPLMEGKQFAGLQGHLWSETLRSDKQVEYMAFPRLLALAERAWHKAAWEIPYDHKGFDYGPNTSRFTEAKRALRDAKWNRFANVLANKELAKLDLQGIEYRIPTVGAKLKDGKLLTNIIFPGLPIEYRIDGGAWMSYEKEPVVKGDKIEVRALSADAKRKGRGLEVNIRPPHKPSGV